MTKMKTVLLVLFLYLLSSASSYGAFAYLATGGSADIVSPFATPTNGLNIDPGEPKTETCPLNGKMYTKTEKAVWETRRPLVIMVENSVEARPHSGLNRTDIVYEAVAEGGVTRFMAVFYCDAARSSVPVAPVRSVRTYFLDWASEYNFPLFGHVGGANCSGEKLPSGKMGPCKTDKRAQAIEQLSDYGWRGLNDLDQMGIGVPMYKRVQSRLFEIIGADVSMEHSVVADTNALYKYAKEHRGFTNLDPDGDDWQKKYVSWKFQDDAEEAKRGSGTAISFDFWEGYKQFDVRWEYDRANNEYKRFTGGEPHLELESKTQLNTKNVVILFTKEFGSVDELKHNLYTTIGEGKALIFQNGNAIEGFWEKKNRLGRTVFTDKKGKEIEFVRGRIWIEVVDTSTTVAY